MATLSGNSARNELKDENDDDGADDDVVDGLIELIVLERQLRLLTIKSIVIFHLKAIILHVKKNRNYLNLWHSRWEIDDINNYDNDSEKMTKSCHRNAINEIETIGLKQIESHTEYTSR